MDFIRTKMSSIGSFLVIAGIISIVLSFINYNLKILVWIDMWGEAMGWVIRIGIVILGGILFLLGKSASSDTNEEQANA